MQKDIVKLGIFKIHGIWVGLKY